MVNLRTHFYLLVIVFDCASSTFVEKNGVEDQTRLMEYLRSALPVNFPPDDLQNNSVHVYVDLYQISDVDEKEGVLTAKIWLYYYYYSESAMWNISEFGGKSRIVAPADTFWTADIIPLDALEVRYLSFEKQIIVGTLGLVAAWTSLATIKFSCSFDVTHFPFDQQACPLRFGPWTYTQDYYRIKEDPMVPLSEADLLYYHEHDEWELVRPLPVVIGERNWRGFSHYDQVTFTINMRRRNLFYSVIFLLPNFLIYALSSLVFLLPVESGEKISFAITILLAAFVSFGTISEILPSSSLNFPTIAYFLGVAVTQMALDTFLATIVINVHHIGVRNKMGRRLRQLITSRVTILFGLRPCPVERAFPGKHPHRALNLTEVTNEQTNNVSKWSTVKAKMTSKTAPAEVTTDPKVVVGKDLFRHAVEDLIHLESDENTQFLWAFLAKLMDRMFLYLHLIATIAVLTYFILN